MRWRATMMYIFDEDGLQVDHVTREILPTEAFRYADDRPDGTALAVHGLWLARNGNCVQGAQMVRQGLSANSNADYLTIQSFVRAEIALQLVDSISGKFEPGKYHDENRARGLDLIQRKAEGKDCYKVDTARDGVAGEDVGQGEGGVAQEGSLWAE